MGRRGGTGLTPPGVGRATGPGSAREWDRCCRPVARARRRCRHGASADGISISNSRCQRLGRRGASRTTCALGGEQALVHRRLRHGRGGELGIVLAGRPLARGQMRRHSTGPWPRAGATRAGTRSGRYARASAAVVWATSGGSLSTGLYSPVIDQMSRAYDQLAVPRPAVTLSGAPHQPRDIETLVRPRRSRHSILHDNVKPPSCRNVTDGETEAHYGIFSQ